MEEEVVIILVPKRVQQRSAESASAYDLHVVGGELTAKQQRKILRALLDELKK